MTELVGEEGLPLAAASYQEMAEMGGAEGTSLSFLVLMLLFLLLPLLLMLLSAF